MLSRLSSLWRNLTRRDRVDREIDDELGAMYTLLIEEKTRAGMISSYRPPAAWMSMTTRPLVRAASPPSP